MFSSILSTVIYKDWAEFDKHRNDPTAQRRAITRNHEIAVGLAHKFQEVKGSSDKHKQLNAHMATQGYLHSHQEENGDHIYTPIPANPKGDLPTNPVIGHKVHIVINPKTGHVDAVSRYSIT